MRRKVKRKQGSLPAAIGFGLLTSWATMLMMSLALALMIISQQLPESAVAIAALVILLLASFCGSLLAVWSAGQKAMLMGAVTAAVYYLSMLCMTALFFDGQYSNAGFGLVAALAGGIGAAFTKLRNPKKRKALYTFR